MSAWNTLGIAALALLCCGSGGCRTAELGGHDWAPPPHHMQPKVPTPPAIMPRELDKTLLPDYVIEAPDILLIDALKVVPKPPYKVETQDVLSIQVRDIELDSPTGAFEVQPGGFVNLGSYGSVYVLGLSLEDTRRAVEQRMTEFLQEPEVSVSLVQGGSRQQISGEHVVGPDGKVTLGSYGKVTVTGLTVDQARFAIENHLSQFLDDPQVAVDIYAYNSKFYYIITQGAGLGDGVAKVVVTGNETVLDALAQINGMEAVSSKRMWIARPAPYGAGCDQVLPVDWHAISTRANTATNYQLLPGDRLVIAEDRLVATDTVLSKIISPIERVFGVTLLGTTTAKNIKFYDRFNSGGGGGF